MKKRGGKREGAGRKCSAVKRLEVEQASNLLTVVEEKGLWKSFLFHADANLALKAFIAWNDRAYGKPKQQVTMDGNITIDPGERAARLAELAASISAEGPAKVR